MVMLIYRYLTMRVNVASMVALNSDSAVSAVCEYSETCLRQPPVGQS